MATINIRVDDDVKQKAATLFADLGMDLSTAVNVFLRKSIMTDGIPFELRRETPNAETLAALEELRQIQSGKIHAKMYSDIDAMFEELDRDAEI